MDSAARQVLAERVLGFSTADETEVSIYFDDHRLTRFTRNAIHQNIATQDVTVRIRAIVGGRTGRDLDQRPAGSFAQGPVEKAHHDRAARPGRSRFPRIAKAPTVAAPPHAFDERTARASAERRANIAAEVFATAERHHFWAAGYVTTSHSGVTIANSKGTHATFDGTDAGINVKQVATDSTGFAEMHATDVASIDGTAVGTVAAEKARTRVIQKPSSPAFGPSFSSRRRLASCSRT